MFPAVICKCVLESFREILASVYLAEMRADITCLRSSSSVKLLCTEVLFMASFRVCTK